MQPDLINKAVKNNNIWFYSILKQNDTIQHKLHTHTGPDTFRQFVLLSKRNCWYTTLTHLVTEIHDVTKMSATLVSLVYTTMQCVDAADVRIEPLVYSYLHGYIMLPT